MTLAQVRGYLSYTDDATLAFKTSAGEEISDETTVEKSGMYVLVSNESASRELKLYMNGEETTVAFTTGTLEVKGTANCYNKTSTAPVALILAQYEGNKLININYTPKTVSGSEEISATIDFEKVANTSLSIFSWDAIGGLCPIADAVKLDVGKYLWMPSVFATGSVMQRDTALNIRGEAAPGTEVTVTLGDKTYTTTAANDASWSVTADAISVENNPYSMTVTTTGGGKLEFTDILAGDVWLCSGQSNMEWQMRRVAGEAADATIKAQAKEDIANSENNNIRLYNQSKNGTADVLKDTKDGAWQYCTSSNVNNFSAVGYYFGRELEADLNVPIGLINASYGGASIQSFMDADTLAANNISYTHSTDPMRNAGRIFNAMVAPIIPYNLKGVIWYQGCANASANADTLYYTYQDIWTSAWRNLWNDSDMPFVITQLAATAEITGTNTVSVTDGTNTPVGVRAAFTGYAEPMYNLYNSADLLATPFRLLAE